MSPLPSFILITTHFKPFTGNLYAGGVMMSQTRVSITFDWPNAALNMRIHGSLEFGHFQRTLLH